jgi:hypothetical protein
MRNLWIPRGNAKCYGSFANSAWKCGIPRGITKFRVENPKEPEKSGIPHNAGKLHRKISVDGQKTPGKQRI